MAEKQRTTEQQEKIRGRAYELWEQEGRPHARHREHWAKAEQELEKLRTPITILFSDIKGSTTFAEKKGDVEYMAMIDRHNRILFPVVEAEGPADYKPVRRGNAVATYFRP